ncbi:LuxR C-terminal-related transcriptional regulator [Acinetobacter sp. RIT698]|nr:LuxR C-terminal-related transcriptional regulator [Acinetobacter sp. RIT698]
MNNILTTKLNPPVSIKPQIERTLIFNHLDQYTKVKLISVIAPAGFGKTTFLNQLYLQQKKYRKVIWMTLDNADNDFNRFIQHLSYIWFKTTNQPFNNNFLENITQYSNPFTIFLDQVEHIYDESTLKFLQQIIDYLPSHSQIVIGSRQLLPLKIASLRIRCQILEINQEALSFNADEINKLALNDYGFQLNPNEINLLLKKTGGWIVAIQQFGLTLTSRHSLCTQIQKFSINHTELNHFLSEEILNQLPNNLQDFLLNCSVYSQFSVADCDWLLKTNNSAHLLKQLEQKNLFLIPMDQQGEKYRFHSLFLSYLRNQFKSIYPEKFRSQHLRAAKRLLYLNQPIEAIEHYLLAKEFDKCVELLTLHGQALLEKGRVRFLLRCLDQIPAHIFENLQHLQTAYTLALILNRRYDEAKYVIEKMKRQKLLSNIETKILDCLWLSMTDRIAESFAACEELYNRQNESDNLLNNFFISIYSHYLIAYNKIDYARKLIHKVINNSRYNRNTFVQTLYEYNEGCIELQQGHLNQAYIRWYTNYNCSWREHQNSVSGGHAMIGVPLAEILYERNQLEESFSLIKNCLPYARQNGHIDSLISAYSLFAKIEYRLNHDKTAALCCLKELEYIGADFNFTRVKANALLEQARIHWLNKDYYLAHKILNEIIDLDVWRTLDHFYMPAQYLDTPQMVIWRIDISNNDGKKHEEKIQDLIKHAQTLLHERRAIKLKMILSTLYFSENNQKQAFDCFTSILLDIGNEKYLRSFLDEGPIMHKLIYAFYENYSESFHLDSNTRKILELLISLVDHSKIKEVHPNIKNVSYDALSKRELEILSHAAEGLRNQEIADKIFLAVTTVKAHLRRIHSKLDAHSRTEAVAIARKNGWL